MKQLIFAAAVLLSLVGAEGQALAIDGVVGRGHAGWADGSGPTPEGISWE